MATAKKAKKSPKRKPSAAQNRLDKAKTPEEVLQSLGAVTEEHDRECAALGNRILRVVERANYHPTVVLDTFQMLLAAAIESALGVEQRKLFASHIHEFHSESRMLSFAQMIGIDLSKLQAEPEEDATPTPETPTPDAGTTESR